MVINHFGQDSRRLQLLYFKWCWQILLSKIKSCFGLLLKNDFNVSLKSTLFWKSADSLYVQIKGAETPEKR